MKLSVSPACSVAAEIVTVAPVRSLSTELTFNPKSTFTACPPIWYVLALPDPITTGGRRQGMARWPFAGGATLTLSVAGMLAEVPSRATIEIVRVKVSLLVVEKVTDRKAA